MFLLMSFQNSVGLSHGEQKKSICSETDPVTELELFSFDPI